jgi:TonB family protein
MKRLFVVAAIIATLLVGCAPVKHVPVVVDPAVLKNAPQPRYPNDAIRHKEQGSVLLLVLVGKDGLPKDIKVIQSSGFDSLDLAAINALSQWTYRPRTVDGVPVEAYLRFPLNFNLKHAKPVGQPQPYASDTGTSPAASPLPGG